MKHDELDNFIDKLPLTCNIWGKQNGKYYITKTNNKNNTNKIYEEYIAYNPKLINVFEMFFLNGKEITMNIDKLEVILCPLDGDTFYELHKEISKMNNCCLKIVNSKISQPLTDIISNLTLMNNIYLDEHAKKYINAIKRSCCELMGVANDIADLIELNSESKELVFAPVNLYHFINECIEPHLSAIGKKGLTIKLNYNPEIPQHIYTDPILLKQAINNILKNSIKYTDIGGIVVEIDIFDSNIAKETKFPFEFIELSSYNSIYILVKIKDTGSGISKEIGEILNGILDINKTNNNKNISGFGLLISKFVINKLRGNIWFHSEPDMGTIFYLTFKAKQNILMYSISN